MEADVSRSAISVSTGSQVCSEQGRLGAGVFRSGQAWYKYFFHLLTSSYYALSSIAPL